MKRALIIGMSLAVTLGGTAFTLPAAALEAPRDYAGAWTLSGVSEGDSVCTATLGTDQAIGGWGVTLARTCAAVFPQAEDVAAWSVLPDGSVLFIDPLRHVLLKFEPIEAGGYVAHPAQGEPVALDRATRDTARLTARQRMSGHWVLNAMGGDRLCGWTSTSDRAGATGRLVRKGACTKAWAVKGVTGWRRSSGRITLTGAKGKAILTLPGDPIEGFYSPATSAQTLGFFREWDE